MKIIQICLLISVMILSVAGPSLSEDGRFGPWVMYAPYYFPAFVYDQCVIPADAWSPKYETPPPPMPKPDPLMELEAKAKKKPKGKFAVQQSPKMNPTPNNIQSVPGESPYVPDRLGYNMEQQIN